MSKFKPLPEKPKPREVTAAGDRSILSIILATIQHAQTEFGRVPEIVWVDLEDCHLLAKELYDRRLTGMVETRDAIEAKIKAGMLTLFGGVQIGVARAQ